LITFPHINWPENENQWLHKMFVLNNPTFFGSLVSHYDLLLNQFTQPTFSLILIPKNDNGNNRQDVVFPTETSNLPPFVDWLKATYSTGSRLGKTEGFGVVMQIKALDAEDVRNSSIRMDSLSETAEPINSTSNHIDLTTKKSKEPHSSQPHSNLASLNASTSSTSICNPVVNNASLSTVTLNNEIICDSLDPSPASAFNLDKFSVESNYCWTVNEFSNGKRIQVGTVKLVQKPNSLDNSSCGISWIYVNVNNFQPATMSFYSTKSHNSKTQNVKRLESFELSKIVLSKVGALILITKTCEQSAPHLTDSFDFAKSNASIQQELRCYWKEFIQGFPEDKVLKVSHFLVIN
jgi:hypothetical protein